MERILIDTDVVLNVLFREEPFFETSSKIFALFEQGNAGGFVTATTLTNIYYIARKRIGSEVARICIGKLLETPGVRILAVDELVLQKAAASPMTDFEDAVQAATANENKIDFIATRNIRDFRKSPVPAVTPTQLLERLETN